LNYRAPDAGGLQRRPRDKADGSGDKRDRDFPIACLRTRRPVDAASRRSAGRL